MRKFFMALATGEGNNMSGASALETLEPLQKAGMEPFLYILAAGGTTAIVLKKSKDGAVEFITFTKDVSGAIRSARIAAGASEQAAAEALGVDLQTYVDFEENGGELDISPANFKSLAKAFKMPVEELAAQMIATPKPVAPAMSGEGNATSGDQNDPPNGQPAGDAIGKSKIRRTAGQNIAVEKGEIGSTQIRSIRIGASLGYGIYTNADLLDAGIPLEKRKEVAKARFTKAVCGFSDPDYAKIQKGGLITADMFGPNPAVDPVLANTIINLFVGEDDLLKQVQTKILTGKKQNVNVMDIPFRTGTRLTAGVWPSNSTGSNTINRSLQFDAKPIDWTWIIPDDTLMTYRGLLPQLEAEITGGFVKALSTDIWDLGLNGTTEVFDGTNFTTLARGWAALMRSGNETGRLSIDAATPAGQQISIGGGGYTTPDAVMDAMFAAAFNPTNQNQRFFSLTTPVLVSSYNYDIYEQQMKASHPTFLIPQEGLPTSYRKRPLNITNKMTDANTYIHTEMSNLVVGIVAGMPGAGGDGISIERFRITKATRMVGTVYVDYGVANSKACIITNA